MDLVRMLRGIRPEMMYGIMEMMLEKRSWIGGRDSVSICMGARPLLYFPMVMAIDLESGKELAMEKRKKLRMLRWKMRDEL